MFNIQININEGNMLKLNELFDGLSGKNFLGHLKKNIVQRNVAEKKILGSNLGMKKNSCTEKLPNPPLKYLMSVPNQLLTYDIFRMNEMNNFRCKQIFKKFNRSEYRTGCHYCFIVLSFIRVFIE